MQLCQFLRFCVRFLNGSLVGTTTLRTVAARRYTYVVLHDVVVTCSEELERVVKILAHRHSVELNNALHGGDMEGNCMHHPRGSLLHLFDTIVPHPRGQANVGELVEHVFHPLKGFLDDCVGGVLLDEPLRTSRVEATVIIQHDELIALVLLHDPLALDRDRRDFVWLCEDILVDLLELRDFFLRSHKPSSPPQRGWQAAEGHLTIYAPSGGYVDLQHVTSPR